jgi:hypothetical protein
MLAPEDAEASKLSKAMEVARMAIPRELSPLGFYSHGAEAARGLPQAKGTAQQFTSMLDKAGIRGPEMESYLQTFGGRPIVTQEEIAKHFQDTMPQIEERVLGVDSVRKSKIDSLNNEIEVLSNKEIAAGRVPAENPRWKELENQYYDLVGNSPTEVPTKFERYTLPGGENYREVLLKLNKEGAKVVPVSGGGGSWGVQLPDGTIASRYYDKFDAEQALRFEGRKAGTTFTSAHWPEPDVVAHLRMTDRTGPNGEKILHVEEIQSDWAQKAREIRDEEVKRVMEKQGVTKEEANNLVPSEFGFKPPRDPMMKEKLNAAEDAYNEAANSHQEMLKQINQSIEKMPDPRTVSPGEYNRAQQAHEAMRQDVMRANPDFEASANRVRQASQDLTSLREQQSLFDKSEGVPTGPYVGKTPQWTDLALKRALKEAAEGGYDRIVFTPGAEQAKRYPDGGIKREEGMKGYYDKIVPKRLQELIKKHDSEARVGAHEIPNTGERRRQGYADVGEIMNWHPSYTNLSRQEQSAQWNAMPPVNRRQLIKDYESAQSGDITGHGIDITPKMRESILKGQTAFKDGGSVVDRALMLISKQA